MRHKIEICACSYESAMAAQKGGADRIELCSVLSVGGVTPSYGAISMVRKNISIDMNVLIRPREGDFLYSDEEVEEVIRDIEACAKANVNGVVIGALTDSGEVDRYMCREWVKFAKNKGMTVTFHRAIDCAVDIIQAMEDVIELHCDRILTSGGSPTAIEGMEVIKKMNTQAGGRIIIMPGSGVNYTNIVELAEYTGVSELHFSATKSRPSMMREFGGIGEVETVTHSDIGLITMAIKEIQ